MIIQYRTLNLDGYELKDPDEDAALATGHYLTYPVDSIWPKTRLFDWWVQQAQKRDDYNPSANSLNDTAWNTIKDYLELALTAKIDAHVLWTLIHCTHRNPAMQSCSSALMAYRRRIQKAMADLNALTYPAGFETIVKYWQKVFMPSETGPICANIFLFGLLNTDHTSGYNTFAVDNLPDLSVRGDVEDLVQNIERAVEELNGINKSTADWLTDLKVIQYHMNMLGVGEPQTMAMPADVDVDKWEDQFVRPARSIRDNTGSRILTNCWVDNDDVEAQLYCQRGLNFLDEFWKGIGDVYAFINEADDYGYSFGSEWQYYCGIAVPVYKDSDADGILFGRPKIYTDEDGWADAVYDFDISAAAGVQALIWKRPDLMVNDKYPTFVFLEEAEEAYFPELLTMGKERAHITVNHIAQGFARYLHETFGLPMYGM
jgi:hypothetical protein